jgi:hypothetical protein
MTAIYWGRSSFCKEYEVNGIQYEWRDRCTHPAAYSAVCFFAVCLFLGELVFTAAVCQWRGELIEAEEVTLYGSTGGLHAVPAAGSETIYLKTPYTQAPTSADL